MQFCSPNYRRNVADIKKRYIEREEERKSENGMRERRGKKMRNRKIEKDNEND